jgi:hypothetical protein
MFGGAIAITIAVAAAHNEDLVSSSFDIAPPMATVDIVVVIAPLPSSLSHKLLLSSLFSSSSPMDTNPGLSNLSKKGNNNNNNSPASIPAYMLLLLAHR